MARTSLFGAFQNLTRQAEAADRLGMPIAEYRGQEAALSLSDLGMSRRTLLKGALIGGAGAAVLGSGIYNPARAYAAPEGKNPTRVAIVGGGIAGLTAALTLHDKGYQNVTVYEANPTRLGGRIWTNKGWANRQISEWGGELIDTGHSVMRGLAKRYGIQEISILDTPYSSLNYFNGQYIDENLVAEEYKNTIYAALRKDMTTISWPITWQNATKEGVTFSNMTIKEWIATRVPGGYSNVVAQILDVAYTIEFGADTDKQSALSLLGLMGYKNPPSHFKMFGISDEKYRFVGGNDQIISAIASEIGGNKIAMGHSLQAVRKNNDGTYTLTFNNGGRTKTVVADHVILALPVSIMADLSRSGGFAQAGFAQRMHDTVRAYPMGENNKVHLQFTERFWNRDGYSGDSYSDNGYQCSWEPTSKQAGTMGILNQYPGGTVALQQRTGVPFAFGTVADRNGVGTKTREIAAAVLAQMDQALPGLADRWSGAATVSLWGNDPLTKGSYSYYAPGYPHKYAGYEEVSQGNIHMAGEWVSIDYQGYMEGGAVTGIAAANKVLAATRTAK